MSNNGIKILGKRSREETTQESSRTNKLNDVEYKLLIEFDKYKDNSNQNNKKNNKMIKKMNNVPKMEDKESQKMLVSIESNTVKDQFYTVSFHFEKNMFNYSCNCGDKYHHYNRNSCIHIGSIIGAMVKQYVANYTKEDGDDSMENIMEKFKHIII
jgi:hypothetical protein